MEINSSWHSRTGVGGTEQQMVTKGVKSAGFPHFWDSGVMNPLGWESGVSLARSMEARNYKNDMFVILREKL